MSDDRYVIDPAHSRFGFSTKHLMVATVRGSFTDLEGYLEAPDGDPTRGRVEVSIRTASVASGSADRDNHLRSADFFGSEEYPEMTFRSKSIAREGAAWVVTGDLTIRDRTREVTLRGESEGPINDGWGNERYAATFTGKINREDWGLTWNVIQEGTMLVGKDVKLEIDTVVMRPVATPAGQASK